MTLRPWIIGLVLITGGALAQTTPKLSFEVASVKASPPPDMQKVMAQAQSGGRMPWGAHIDGARAEYIYMPLTNLIAIAYKVKADQITGPDWLANERFDIIAKLPAGSSPDDAPQMLESLLEERFQLRSHRETRDRPVLALIAGKGAPKLTETEPAKPLDLEAPLKPGEMEMDEGNGPIRMYTDKTTGEEVMNAGVNGKYTVRVDQGSMVMHMEASQLTMAGFADMLTQFAQLGSGGQRVVDLTGLKGSYNLTFNFSLADLMAIVRARVAEAAGGASDGTPGAAPAAAEPSGGASLPNAVAALGLKLEPRKLPVEQLIIDHVERKPIEN